MFAPGHRGEGLGWAWGLPGPAEGQTGDLSGAGSARSLCACPRFTWGPQGVPHQRRAWRAELHRGQACLSVRTQSSDDLYACSHGARPRAVVAPTTC